MITCWPKPGRVVAWLKHPPSTLLAQCYWPDAPPRSRVRASDQEWEKLVRAGVERKMMREVKESDILRDQRGALVLNGAGAVPKIKLINGQDFRLQRFISNLVPANSYQQQRLGDDRHLPYLGQMAMLEVESEQELLIDSERPDIMFQPFSEWVGMMTFAKQVSSEVFGGDPGQKSWVGMSVAPMECLKEDSEISKAKVFLEDPSKSLV